MRFLSIAKDGGEKSTVTGFYIIEIKRLLSIVVLVFQPDTGRGVYHSHAFNALSWVLRGTMIEQRIFPKTPWHNPELRAFRPSIFPKITPRNNVHRVHTPRLTYVLTLRGPWSKTWEEYRYGSPSDEQPTKTTLTHGRKVVE